MNRSKRLALFAALCLGQPAFAADWVQLADNALVTLSLNPDRKTEAGGQVVQYRIDFKEPRKFPDGKTLSSSTMTVLVSCPAQTLALTETVAHSGTAGTGTEVLREKVKAPVANRVMPGSSDEIIFTAVCPGAKLAPAVPARPAPAAPAPAKPAPSTPPKK
jgi:hypothetical protein